MGVFELRNGFGLGLAALGAGEELFAFGRLGRFNGHLAGIPDVIGLCFFLSADFAVFPVTICIVLVVICNGMLGFVILRSALGAYAPVLSITLTIFLARNMCLVLGLIIATLGGAFLPVRCCVGSVVKRMDVVIGLVLAD